MNVYDFDNTLYDGESALDFFLFCLKKRPSLLRYIPSALKAVVDYKRQGITIDDIAGRYGEIMRACLQGLGDYQAATKVFWDRHEHRIRPFYKPLQRPDDLVITAGPEQSMKEICGRLGIAHYIGTVVNEASGEIEFVCFKENKVQAFHERYPGQEIDDFYTDSMNDKPLMDISKRVFLVEKGKVRRIK
ncbi:MAG: haloacid dehalogenase-like hydrolase [Oscillospiraceae bacterium]|nr:haloacid dehalogenase-like hydrolase [Oscillospiraceae bacterium]